MSRYRRGGLTTSSSQVSKRTGETEGAMPLARMTLVMHMEGMRWELDRIQGTEGDDWCVEMPVEAAFIARATVVVEAEEEYRLRPSMDWLEIPSIW